MKQEGNDTLDEFRLLVTWANLLAVNEATLVGESLGLEKIPVDNKSGTLRDRVDTHFEKALAVFRKRARALYGELLRRTYEGVTGRDPGPPTKEAWKEGKEVAKHVVDRETPRNVIERLRELLALHQLATTDPLEQLPGDRPWEDCPK